MEKDTENYGYIISIDFERIPNPNEDDEKIASELGIYFNPISYSKEDLDDAAMKLIEKYMKDGLTKKYSGYKFIQQMFGMIFRDCLKEILKIVKQQLLSKENENKLLWKQNENTILLVKKYCELFKDPNEILILFQKFQRTFGPFVEEPPTIEEIEEIIKHKKEIQAIREATRREQARLREERLRAPRRPGIKKQ
jgi:hypothetical protein